MSVRDRKVLVLGGTGTMGVPLCRFLCDDGFDVCVTTRRDRRDFDGVRYYRGDAKDLSFIEPLLKREKPDAIVDFMDYDTRTFGKNCDYLLSSCSHYLFLSSYRVYADEANLTEQSKRLLDVCTDHEYLATDEYALHKARSEDLLTSSSYENWTILRPGIIYSNGCFKFGCLESDTVMFRALHGLPVVMPREMFLKTTTLTSSSDAARLISKLVLNSRAYSNIYNISTSEHCTWGDIAGIYHDAIGMEVRDIPLPVYCKICNRYQVLYDRMFNRAINNEKVLRDTQSRQEQLIPLKVGLREDILAFGNNPEFKDINIYQNAIIDMVCGTRIGFSNLSMRQLARYYGYRYEVVWRLKSAMRFCLGRLGFV